MGNDGTVVVFSGHHPTSHSRNSQSRISLPADGPLGRDRDSLELWHSSGRQLAFHVRCDAKCTPEYKLGDGCILSCAAWIWCQSAPRAPACMAARSTPCRAFSGLSTDERLHARDSVVWIDSGQF